MVSSFHDFSTLFSPAEQYAGPPEKLSLYPCNDAAEFSYYIRERKKYIAAKMEYCT
jgi:hypothetical protein